MTNNWVTTAASAVQPGERVRLPSGDEMTATRVDRKFMGIDTMVALIEDTTERWFKRPLAADAEVEVQRPATGPIADQPIRTLSGEPTTLAEHAGKALLVVNVASKCGLTPHYEGSSGSTSATRMPASPSSGSRATSSVARSRAPPRRSPSSAPRRYSVTFPVYEKIDVNGTRRHPIFATLTAAPDAEGTAGEVQWNFEKFVVAPDGEVVARFRPPTDPEAPELVAAIEGVLPRQET